MILWCTWLPGHEVCSDRWRLHILASIALPVGEACNLKARLGSWRSFAPEWTAEGHEGLNELAVLDPRAAFVDVGSEKMHVSIAGGPPALFGTVTSQLHALRDYLAEHQVRSVAMEATGVRAPMTSKCLR